MMEQIYKIDLQSFGGDKGSLIAFEQNTEQMPFELKRVYYIYRVPSDARRGFHAHKNLKQLGLHRQSRLETLIIAGFCKKV